MARKKSKRSYPTRGWGALKLRRPSRMREIASAAGKAAHRIRPGKGLAHEWDAEAARQAGIKGGKTTAAKRALARAERDAERASVNGDENGNARNDR